MEELVVVLIEEALIVVLLVEVVDVGFIVDVVAVVVEDVVEVTSLCRETLA